MVMWKPTGRIGRLAARSTPSTIALVRSNSPLLLSAKFQPNPSLTIFSNSAMLAI